MILKRPWVSGELNQVVEPASSGVDPRQPHTGGPLMAGNAFLVGLSAS
jgi:hypothetical protein